jgi:Arc/MetJ-type ribon-helix-helix transcriptional regulator
MTRTRIAVRLPEELVGRLDALVPGLHESRSDAVRRSIELYLYRLACEQDVARYEAEPLSDDELAVADDPSAWSGTPEW